MTEPVGASQGFYPFPKSGDPGFMAPTGSSSFSAGRTHFLDEEPATAEGEQFTDQHSDADVDVDEP